jgi:tetratricopeptide (TPR) repeat protein
MLVSCDQAHLQEKLIKEQKYAEAETVGTTLLKSVESQHGKSNEHYRHTAHLLLDTLVFSKKFAAAETMGTDLYRRSITELGPTSDFTISIANSLANGYHFQEKHVQAANLYSVVMERQLELMPTDVTHKASVESHEHFMESMRDVAISYLAKNSKEAALIILKKIQELNVRTFGLYNPRSINSQCDLAMFYCAANTLDLAEPAIKDLVEAFYQLAGPKSEDAVIWKKNLGSLYARHQKPEEAEREFNECLAILRQRNYDDSHPDVAETLKMIADLKLAPPSTTSNTPH